MDNKKLQMILILAAFMIIIRISFNESVYLIQVVAIINLVAFSYVIINIINDSYSYAKNNINKKISFIKNGNIKKLKIILCVEYFTLVVFDVTYLLLFNSNKSNDILSIISLALSITDKEIVGLMTKIIRK